MPRAIAGRAPTIACCGSLATISKVLETGALALLGLLFGYVSGADPGPQSGNAFRFLVGVLASTQDGAQQAVDTLSQHATIPGAVQYLAQGIPGQPEVLWFQQRGRFIQLYAPISVGK